MGLDMYLIRVPRGTDTSPDTFFDIGEEVAYWRKANEIHKWFVDRVQDGVDDCGIHNEVTMEDISNLHNTCKNIINGVRLIPGKVTTRYRVVDGKWEPEYREGLVVDDVSLCEQILPRQSGFFFGGSEYDEFYMDDIKRTAEICERLIKEIDPNKDALYYSSSW